MIRRPLVILGLLTGLNLLNYMDRFLLAAVLPRVAKELALSDFESGAMATVFLIGYFVTSPLFGAMGDRGKRKGLIALGVALWSIATVGSGLSWSALTLFIARALVGVGEASYATLAPTIIDDLAPAEKRGRWLAVFYLATPVGSALGYLIGGAIEHAFGWRMTFLAAGIPGVVLALLCLLIKEPVRTSPRPPSFVASLGQLRSRKLYVQCVAGYCASTFAVGGFAFWAPSYLFRAYALPLERANFLFGAVTVVAGAIGTVIGGLLGDHFVKKIQTSDPDEATALGNLKVCAISAWFAAPCAAVAVLAGSPLFFFIAMGLCESALFMSSSPVNAVLLRSVPAALRGSAMAASIFSIHLFGDLWSPPAVGAINDHLPPVSGFLPMQLPMLLLPLAVFVSALLWTFPRRKPVGSLTPSA